MAGPRNDTAFWQACKELRPADDFQEKVRMYKAGLAVNMPITAKSTCYANFDAEFREFWSNYYCIFAGLDHPPDHSLPALAARQDVLDSAEPVFAQIKPTQKELLTTLPSTYGYLKQLHGK
ncbi:tryptophan 7-halogenase [Saccharothrix sp. S26]|uniref:tryptophan 7-halogenase n=1 Tax=Saccharothrix sp. S26 TaxID=2907215 RepID=UPI001F2C52F4|nr:tryptophan 7-halogenase [Saccharothrix sp. S26]MCE6999002.1 tryptophan 7-halogenase [Saccharothrix sp. S26]